MLFQVLPRVVSQIEQLSLEDLISPAVAGVIRQKLSDSPTNELNAFTVLDEDEAAKIPVYVIHDERQDLSPMTLVFIMDHL